MTRDEVFDEIYEAIALKLEDSELNPDGAIILSYVPSKEFDAYPVVVLSQLNYRLDRETLGKTEKKHAFTIEAQIFSIDKPLKNRREIGNNIANIVEDVIQNDYGLTLDMSNAIPNLDENIYRIMMRFTGLIDDDTKIIYREI